MSDILPSPSHPHRTGRLRAMLLLGLLGLVLVTAALLAYLAPKGTGQRIGVGDTLTLAKDRRVLNATLRDEDALIVGDAKPGRGLLPKGGRFSAELPSNGKLTLPLTALLAATRAQVTVDHQDGKERARLLLTTLIPVLALTDLVWLVMLSPRNARSMGTAGWPTATRSRTVGSDATAEVVVMSSNPTVAAAGRTPEVVLAPAVKAQGRKASPGRHVRTSASRSSGSGDAVPEEGATPPPAKARKRAGPTTRAGEGMAKTTARTTKAPAPKKASRSAAGSAAGSGTARKAAGSKTTGSTAAKATPSRASSARSTSGTAAKRGVAKDAAVAASRPVAREVEATSGASPSPRKGRAAAAQPESEEGASRGMFGTSKSAGRRGKS